MQDTPLTFQLINSMSTWHVGVCVGFTEMIETVALIGVCSATEMPNDITSHASRCNGRTTYRD